MEEPFTPKLLEEAKGSQVVWARVKGYPWWPVGGGVKVMLYIF